MKKKSNNYSKRLMLFFAIFVLGVLPSSILAQDAISVQVTVFDSDGLSIPGVTVVVQGTTRGTVTGNDGEFSITVPKGSTLEFSFIGYERQSVIIDDASDLKIGYLIKTF